MTRWQDVINAIRQRPDQKRPQDKKAGFINSVRNVVDTAADTASNAAHVADNAAERYFRPVASDNTGYVHPRARDFLRELPGASVDVASAVGNFAADAFQGAARGVAGLGKSVANTEKSKTSRLDEMLAIPETERDKLADQGDDPENTDSRAIFLSMARRQMGGNLSDDAIKKRMKDIKSNKYGDKEEGATKDSNPVARFLFGTEKDEKITTAEKRNEDIQAGLESKGVNAPAASGLAVVGTTGLSLLDAPTGGAGSVIKNIGKEGIDQLVKATSKEGVENILKSRFPSMADDVIKSVSEKLAATTDAKVIKNTLKEVGTRATGLFQNPKNVVAGAVDSSKKIISPSEVKAAAPTPVGAVPTPGKTPSGYGEASDELLGNIKSSSEATKALPKNKFMQQFKEQFIDKLSPVNDMVKTIEQRTGSKLATEDNPYALHRLSQGMPEKVQQAFGEVTDVLKQAPDLQSVKLIGMARQILSRDERGITSTVSADRARQIIEEQRQRLGPEAFDKVAGVVDTVQAHNKKMLDSLHDEGIISDQAYKAIDESGGDYFAKMNVLSKILTNDANRALFASSGSSNVTKQSIQKAIATATGHAEGTEILDPLESLFRGTETTMNLINRNRTWKAYKRLSEKAPDMIVNIRDPEDVIKSIGLKSDIKEMVPVKNALDRTIRTSSRAVRRLETQINQLQKKGLNLSLKDGGERMTGSEVDAAGNKVAGDFSVAGLGGKVPTSQAGKNVVTTPGEKQVFDALGEAVPTNPSKLGPRDTGSFVRNLIESGSRSDIDKIKKMIDRRDTKTHALLDHIGELKTQFDEAKGAITNRRNEIKGLEDTPVPDGYQVISGFDKGVQGKLAVPSDVAEVFMGKTKAQQDYITSTMTKINGFVKQNLTSNNPGFALITNPLRDTKSFAYNAQDVKADPYHIGKALISGFISRAKQDDFYKRYVAAGGKSGFYSSDKATEDTFKDVAMQVSGKRKVTSLGVKVMPVTDAKSFIREFTRVVTAPLRTARDALHGAASVLEDAPRVAQFKSSLAANKTDATAALNARNVTVDFNQSGRAGQVLNAWIPFLNARAQGTLKSAEAIKRNPARAAAVYTTLTAAPIALAALHNQQYPEVMKMIPDQDRQQNFIFVLDDHKDEKGKYDHVIRLPKSDVDKVLGNPLEQFMRMLAHDDPQNLQEIITNMVGEALPIDTVKDSKFNVSRTVGSTILASPVFKAPAEAATNHSFYNDSDLVPVNKQGLPASEQVREDDPNTKMEESSTSKVGRFAGALTGTSPIKAENTIRAFTGSLLTQNPKDQISGKVSGAGSTKMTNEFYKILKTTSPNKLSASNHINEMIAAGNVEAAQQTADTYNAYVRQQFTDFGQRYGKDMTPELAELYDKQKINLTPRTIKQRRRNAIAKQQSE